MFRHLVKPSSGVRNVLRKETAARGTAQIKIDWYVIVQPTLFNNVLLLINNDDENTHIGVIE